MEDSRYKFVNFSEGNACVLTLRKIVYIVNFFEDTYICLEFQDCPLSCYYTIAICKNQILNLKDIISPIYTVDNYCNTYSEDFALNLI